MPQLTLKRPDIERLAAYVSSKSLQSIIVVKNHGAFVGACVSEVDKCIFYFKGCNPEKDVDFYDNARRKFGGDDIYECLAASDVVQAAKDPAIKSLKFDVSETRIVVQAYK